MDGCTVLKVVVVFTLVFYFISQAAGAVESQIELNGRVNTHSLAQLAQFEVGGIFMPPLMIVRTGHSFLPL